MLIIKTPGQSWNRLNQRLASKLKNLFKLLRAILGKAILFEKLDCLFVVPGNAHFLFASNKRWIPQIDHLYCDFERLGIKGAIFIPPEQNMPSRELANPVYKIGGLIAALPERLRWNLVLKKTEPLFIVGINIPRALILEAKKLKIPTVEIYHGFEYETPEYLTAYDSELDVHIVYDDVTCDTLKKMNSPGTLFRARHPYLDRKLFFEERNISLVENLERSLSKKFSHPGNPLVIYTLQWGYEQDSMFGGIIDNENGVIHSEMITVMRERRDINWVLRWHPVQINRNNFERNLKFVQGHFADCPHIVTDGYNECEIIDLFKLSVLHITMSSMSAVEAMLVGVKTILLHQPEFGLQNHLLRQRKIGYSIPSKLDRDEINRTIEKILNERRYFGNSVLEKEAEHPKTINILLRIFNEEKHKKKISILNKSF